MLGKVLCLYVCSGVHTCGCFGINVKISIGHFLLISFPFSTVSGFHLSFLLANWTVYVCNRTADQGAEQGRKGEPRVAFTGSHSLGEDLQAKSSHQTPSAQFSLKRLENLIPFTINRSNLLIVWLVFPNPKVSSTVGAEMT